MKTISSKLTIRRSNERGTANHGWLNSHHTFSFGEYYDPAHMGFRSLRVINDDRVAPGGGFPTHPHSNMEIFSYVLEGTLAHQDSLGNRRELRPGGIQLMRAGSGVTHSEFNPSSDQTAHFLQIWITPNERGLTPTYTEWTPSPESEQEKTLVISSDGREQSAHIAQDADIFRLKTDDSSSTIHHQVREGRGIWLHVIRGEVRIAGETLRAGDAASVEEPVALELETGDSPFEALLFDLK